MKGRFTFKYTNPKVTYDEKKDKYFILTFGGKKKYFNNEDEYDTFVRRDREKKYRKFLRDHAETESMAKRVGKETRQGRLFGR